MDIPLASPMTVPAKIAIKTACDMNDSIMWSNFCYRVAGTQSSFTYLGTRYCVVLIHGGKKY
ncbi:uncharacterized protein Bfra_002968 [Botrytis fragariae]|uniref:Uncharacterized protein n=1 Tax=Botrytis fragariae TaxID=1964551 RepID=A0A8H6AZC4_9HELO|nr:uncharacterized protein Bfra_002968 [Botrytis fragariae]KAF5876563.1 hypothetical protein Bfra_002968 [Botrytis fragariae]